MQTYQYIKIINITYDIYLDTDFIYIQFEMIPKVTTCEDRKIIIYGNSINDASY